MLYDAFDAMEHVVSNEETFLRAGKLGYDLARKGKTASAVDLLIAQIAIENSLALLTRDEHFSMIAKHSTLLLLK